jgi:hypothetical protein
MWWRCEVDGNHKIRWREKTEIREKIKRKKRKERNKKREGYYGLFTFSNN